MRFQFYLYLRTILDQVLIAKTVFHTVVVQVLHKTLDQVLSAKTVFQSVVVQVLWKTVQCSVVLLVSQSKTLVVRVWGVLLFIPWEVAPEIQVTLPRSATRRAAQKDPSTLEVIPYNGSPLPPPTLGQRLRWRREMYAR